MMNAMWRQQHRHASTPIDARRRDARRAVLKIVSEKGVGKQQRVSAIRTGLQLKNSIPLQVAVLTAEERQRANEQSDAFFYSVPRFVQYVDDNFNRQLKSGEQFSGLSCKGGVVLDLCSGYDSHLPEMELKNVIGHGMCGPEMAANARLDSHFVKDLNDEATVPAEDRFYDNVLCCMGLQYLKYPEDVCYDVQRILKPGGKFLVSFTSHCFPEKTVVGWLERTLEERVQLVKRLMRNAGFVDVQSVSSVPMPDGPDVVSDSVLNSSVYSEMRESFDLSDSSWPSIDSDSNSDKCDPFYGIIGFKPASDASDALSEWGPVHLGSVDGPSQTWDAYYQCRRAMTAYRGLCHWATTIGIPESAVLQLEDDDTIESLRKKRDYMKGMIDSFMSSGL